MKRAANVDKNQVEIVAILRSFNCYVVHTHQLKNFCDVIAYRDGITYTIEIKQTSKHKLTEGEDVARQGIEGAGCKYSVIYSMRCVFKLLDVSIQDLSNAICWTSKNVRNTKSNKALKATLLTALDASYKHCKDNNISPAEL
jgi:hypothetical protein